MVDLEQPSATRGQRPSSAVATVRAGPLMALPGLVRRLGRDPAPLFTAAGFELAQFIDPETRLPYVATSRLLARCVAATGCEQLGLLLGEAATPSSLGIPGFMLRSAPDVGSALGYLVEYLDVHDTGGAATLRSAGGVSLLGYAIHEHGTEAVDQIYDLSVVVIFKVLKTLCGPDWQPTEVLLSRRRPQDPLPYKRLFRAPLTFGSESTAVAFPTRWLTQPISSVDPMLHTHLQNQAIALRTAREQDLPREVRRLVRQSLAGPKSTAAGIARQLQMHQRTLNRRLRERGTTFRREFETVRYDVARQLLVNDTTPLAEVAATLGYADGTAFSRAFKRWSGASPTEWRSRHMLQSRVQR